MMAVLTLLPLGTLQLLAAIDQGYWYARSAEFMQQPLVELLIWMRVPGDMIFSIGALAFALFVLRVLDRPEARSRIAGRVWVSRVQMIEFYPEIKLVHVIAVLASGLLFLLRGSLVQVGRSYLGARAIPALPKLHYRHDTADRSPRIAVDSAVRGVHQWLARRKIGAAARLHWPRLAGASQHGQQASGLFCGCAARLHLHVRDRESAQSPRPNQPVLGHLTAREAGSNAMFDTAQTCKGPSR